MSCFVYRTPHCYLPISRHANTVDDRLARVEDTLQRFMPMYNIWAKENNMPSQESCVICHTDWRIYFSTNISYRLLSSTGRPASSATIRSTPSTSAQVERPRVPYRPSSAIQKLMLPTPDSSLNLQSPVINSEQGDEYPTKWSHKSSHLTRDSYGNLRLVRLIQTSHPHFGTLFPPPPIDRFSSRMADIPVELLPIC